MAGCWLQELFTAVGGIWGIEKCMVECAGKSHYSSNQLVTKKLKKPAKL